MNRSQRKLPEQAMYRVFVILASHPTVNPRTHTYKSVCVGQCENPSSALPLVRKALRSQTIVDPKFVLLVPESQLQAPLPK
jgi:hypothetical protein